jgi:mRNA-degrading endonuclease RelE of RelBE toxin-antitoxin system/uncharacterized membrane protein YqjE
MENLLQWLSTTCFMHPLAMSSGPQILLIYMGIYLLILLGIWIWQFACKGRVSFLSIAALLSLWPVTLPLVIWGMRNHFRNEGANSRLRKEREELKTKDKQVLENAIDQGIQSAEESNEILPEERTGIRISLNAFKTDNYEPVAISLLRREVQHFWRAHESATNYVSLWFGDLDEPNDYPLFSQRVRYAKSGSARPETSHGEWLVALTRDFMKSVAQIDRKLQGRILEALGEIAQDPVTVKGDTIKPLSHEFVGLWRYRLGDFRLIYQPLPGKRHVLLLALAPRGSAYG